MADGSPAGPADGLTPRQEEVRRLLADARHTGPIPEDVAGRLDEVLAGLAAGSDDEAAATAGTRVVSLASRRRRRATTALVAAAAVVAVGVGLGQIMGDGLGGGGSEDSTAASSAKEGGANSDRVVPQPPRAQRDARLYVVDTPPVPVSPRHFAADVRRIRVDLAPLAVGQTSKNPSALSSSPAGGGACDPDHWGAGTFVPVRYDGRSGVLVFRAPRGDSQVVELFGCGSPEVLRSVTLPAP